MIVTDFRPLVYKARLSFAAIGLMCALPAASQPKLERYKDAEFGYGFAVPAGWEQKTDLPRPMVAFLAPEENQYRANFSVNVFTKPVKPNEEKGFLKSVLSEYKKQKATLTPQTRTTLGGSPAWHWSATLSVPNFPTVENRQIVCFRAGRAYILTFTFLPRLKAKYAPQCEKLLASFRFERATAKPKSRP